MAGLGQARVPAVHPGVSHVAGIGAGDLVVVDVWGSEGEFGRFAQAELAPRAGDRVSEMQTRFAQVRNHIQVKSPANA